MLISQGEDMLAEGLGNDTPVSVLTAGLAEAAGSGGTGGGGTVPSAATVRIIRDGGTLTSVLTAPDGSIGAFVGNVFGIEYRLTSEDGTDVIPILPGSVVTGDTTNAVTGAVLSPGVACTIVYGDGGVINFPLSAADTAAAGPVNNTITVTGPDGSVQTYGPKIIKVRAK